MTKFLIRIFSFLLPMVVCVMAFAQDPDWHVVPKDDLSGTRGEIARQLQTDADEATCLQVLQRDGTDDDTLYLKKLACMRLGTHGTVGAIPQLVSMLDLENQGFFARYALETIPGEEVDTVLCMALSNHQVERPAAVAGVLTTLGVRANPVSAETAQAFLGHEDAEVRKAAGYAFACCGGDAAIEYFSNRDLDVLQADSGFLLAETFAKNGETDKAIALYESLANAVLSDHHKESAVYWTILTLGNEGTTELVTQINASDPAMFLVAMKAGRELPAGETVTKAMIAQLDNLPDPLRKALLVRAIGDRTDDASKAVSLPVVADLAKSGDEVVRVAAIDALRNIGDGSVLATLIEAANQTDCEPVAAAAQKTLAELPGAQVDAAIVELLEKGDTAAKIAAIGLIEQRRIISAFPQLQKGLEDSDANVRKAALDALGQVASIDELPLLLGFLNQAKSPEDLEALKHVLKSACTRMPQDAVAAEVADMMKTSPTPTRIFLLELLMEVAGPKALEVVESYAWGTDVELKDKATALLGQWRSPKDIDRVADACLKLAKESRESRFKIRGLRGYIRLARQFDMPEEKRLVIIRNMFDLSNRDEDKVLIFDVFGRYPSPRMLDAALEYIDKASFADKACEAVVIIGEKTPDPSEKVAAAMKTVLKTSQNADLKARAQRVLDRQ